MASAEQISEWLLHSNDHCQDVKYTLLKSSEMERTVSFLFLFFAEKSCSYSRLSWTELQRPSVTHPTVFSLPSGFLHPWDSLPFPHTVVLLSNVTAWEISFSVWSPFCLTEFLSLILKMALVDCWLSGPKRSCSWSYLPPTSQDGAMVHLSTTFSNFILACLG